MVAVSKDSVDAVRRFNRFYTQRMGILNEGLLRSPFSLVEVRVLYELAHRPRTTAAELRKDLGIDAGYLSRILAEFERHGFVSRRPSDTDGRQSLIELTEDGRAAFAPLDVRQSEEVAAMLEHLTPMEHRHLGDALRTAQQILEGKRSTPASYILRPHRPGDLGWIVHRHGAMYSEEFGYDETFEGMVAEIAGNFLQQFDPNRERCWIAEMNGAIVGSVVLVRVDDEVAKLRLLFVEPSARGLGIGRRLVEECIRFARQKRYAKITLWTQSHLDSARAIYQSAGFQLISEEPQANFGRDDLVAQVWELGLGKALSIEH